MATTNPQTAAPRRSKESDNLGSFQRQEQIGQGSFATVYKAIHTNPHGDQTIVAIKSVNLGKLNKKLKDNLTSEISILKGLHHPHIVALIDCKDTGSHIHLVMEYVALGDLSYFIKKKDKVATSDLVGNMFEKYPLPREGGLHEVVSRHFLQQLASALQFLRARNLIHRDVKPQNLLLSPSPDYFKNHRPPVMPYCASDDALSPVCGIRSLPMLKIADFGFARSLPSTALAETLCGSPLYMAPEILRYEKYDAKADLWSVGTVLFEMVMGRAPFKALNHVDLLRKIEKGEDKIRFGEGIAASRELKSLIRSLLKRDPKERLGFPEFFANEIVCGPIPGLVAEDIPKPDHDAPRTSMDRHRSTRPDPVDQSRPAKIQDLPSPYSRQEGFEDAPMHQPADNLRRLPSAIQDATTPTDTKLASQPESTDRASSAAGRRPSLISHATAPGRPETIPKAQPLSSTGMARQRSTESTTRPQSLLREQVQLQQRAKTRAELEAERAAQDLAIDRDYVLVEKRAVEVNALADELEANRRLSRNQQVATSGPRAGAMVRRATTQGPPTSTTGAQANASRAVQIASGRRPDHARQSSYERRYGPSPSSAASAISKVLNSASNRLFGVGFSPPVNFRPGGRSPPVGYSPFPAYPNTQTSLVMVGDGGKTTAIDDDTRFVHKVEDIATRSDVVYGFAEVKYRQLTPAAPSAPNAGLTLQQRAGDLDDGNVDLTPEATVSVSEEALVLYVKALSLLAKAMDIAARWWSRRNQADELTGRGSNVTATAAQRMNNVVQWTRARFNEVLEKADLVRLKLVESQKRLPTDHPSHPSNHFARTASSAGSGASADQVLVSSDITAERLLYDRALEMSRSAAISELTGDDLYGCELSYVTAIRLLEAVLETDEEVHSNRASMINGKSIQDEADDDNAPINGLEVEDRKTVKNVIHSIRDRLTALRRKLQVIQKRASAPVIASPTRASPPIPHRTSNPTIAATPPR